MTDDTKDTGESEQKTSRDYDAYAVRQDRKGKGHFHKIGAAFAHKDGHGYDLDLVAAPTNGRVTLRTPQARIKGLREQDQQEESNKTHSRRADQELER